MIFWAWIIWAASGVVGLFWIWLTWRLDRMEFLFRCPSSAIGGS